MCAERTGVSVLCAVVLGSRVYGNLSRVHSSHGRHTSMTMVTKDCIPPQSDLTWMEVFGHQTNSRHLAAIQIMPLAPSVSTIVVYGSIVVSLQSSTKLHRDGYHDLVHCALATNVEESGSLSRSAIFARVIE